jgi:hypothetical protein
VGAVDERFRQVELAAVDQVIGERLQQSLQHTAVDPALEASEAR